MSTRPTKDSTDLRPLRVPKVELAEFGKALLRAAGATPENARVVIDHLLEADTMGLKSHGVIRVPQYLDDIAAGGIDPVAAPVFSARAAAQVLADGRKGFGQVVGMAMAAEAVRRARDIGISFVAGRHMGHTGRVGAYAEAIAREGLVGVVVCSGPRSGHFVAPFGGREGRLATNPIAYGIPVEGGFPIVADFSTSVVPEGVVRSLKNRGLPTPEGALRDAEGNLTMDPEALYRKPRGSLQPLGGAFGYRGTALSIFVDVLAALLADDDTDDLGREGSNLAMIAIATDGLFAGRAAKLSAYVRSSAPLDAGKPVMLPGEREQREVARAGDGPILVDAPTFAALIAAAKGKFAPPTPLAD